MNTRVLSAYNELSKMNLGSGIAVVDSITEPIRVLKILMEGLAPSKGTGFWIIRFQGLPIARSYSPFDLIYLDDAFRVLHTVEITQSSNFVPFKGIPSSALVLPPTSIVTSKTFNGDSISLRPDAHAPGAQELPAQIASLTARGMQAAAATSAPPAKTQVNIPTVPAEKAPAAGSVLRPAKKQAAPAATTSVPARTQPAPGGKKPAAPDEMLLRPPKSAPVVERTSTPAPKPDQPVEPKREVAAKAITSQTPSGTPPAHAQIRPTEPPARRPDMPPPAQAPSAGHQASAPAAPLTPAFPQGSAAKPPAAPAASPAAAPPAGMRRETPAAPPSAPRSTMPAAAPDVRREVAPQIPTPPAAASNAGIAAEPRQPSGTQPPAAPPPRPVTAEPAPHPAHQAPASPAFQSAAGSSQPDAAPFAEGQAESDSTEEEPGTPTVVMHGAKLTQDELFKLLGADKAFDLVELAPEWPGPPPKPRQKKKQAAPPPIAEKKEASESALDQPLLPGEDELALEEDELAFEEENEVDTQIASAEKKSQLAKMEAKMAGRWDVQLLYTLFPELHPGYRPEFQVPYIDFMKIVNHPEEDDKLSMKIQVLSWLYPELELDTVEQRQREHRRAPRVADPGLVGYYFSSGSSEPHPVRNFSVWGFYMITDEKWLPGTIIRLTLQVVGTDGTNPGDALTVHARVVNWDKHGAGFEFVLPGFLGEDD